MKQGLWSLAKGLQASALCVVGYSLYVGVSSTDATTELKWLMAGAVIFLVGVLLERFSSGGEGG